MVRLSTLLLIRKTGFDTPFRVTKKRYIANNAEYLFKDFKNVKVTEQFDGTLKLTSENIIRLALDGCTNRPSYRIVVAERKAERDSEVCMQGFETDTVFIFGWLNFQ